MNLVFISNIHFTRPEINGYSTDNAIATKSKSVAEINELVKKINQDEENIFIIDVHCCFTEKTKMQDQGGVTIYRLLLNVFKENQDKLRVIFYSPISQDSLVVISKGENYILKLHPFIDCNYDGQFERDLKTILTANSFPQFNNASENLLSGWAINNKDSIKSISPAKNKKEKEKPRRIAFIDDQNREIFEAKSDLKFLEYKKNQILIGNFSAVKIDNLTNHIKQSALVVSDFYLEENHESNNWMSSKELSLKSGFQLFQTIKGTINNDGIHKGVPFIMHTSSNKIQYYKFLDANGVDNWLVKDTRPDASAYEKKENYFAFKKVIEEFTVESTAEHYAILKKYWERIQDIETVANSLEKRWWYSATSSSDNENINTKDGYKVCRKATIHNKQEIINLLKDSWMAIRANLNRESLFAENIGSADRNFTAASVCSNLGKLFEFFSFSQGMHLNTYFKFLFCVRNIGSHYKNYKDLELNDALIYFDCWLTALEKKDTKVSESFKTLYAEEEFILQGKTHYVDDCFANGLLFIYIQFMNGFHLSETTIAYKMMVERIEYLLNKADKYLLTNEIEADFYNSTGLKLLIKKKQVKYKNGNRNEGENYNRIASNWVNGGQYFKIISEQDGRLYITNNG